MPNKTKGNVAWAVALYRKSVQAQKAVTRCDSTLNRWLNRLTDEEFKEYAAITLKMDEQENERETA